MYVLVLLLISQSSFPPLPSVITPVWGAIFWSWTNFLLSRDHHLLDVFFHSNTIYLFRPSLRSKQHLPFILWNYNSPCRVKKQCYQTSTFLSLWLLWARFQVRFPFASVALLVELKDWFPPSLLGCCSPKLEPVIVTGSWRVKVPLSVSSNFRFHETSHTYLLVFKIRRNFKILFWVGEITEF